MKRLFVITLVIIMLFSFSAAAQEAETADIESENLENLDLSQEKTFSDSAREELLGIASQFESSAEIENIQIENSRFNLTGNGSQQNPGLQLLSDLNLNTEVNKEIINDEIVNETQLQLEYAINSRALIRAGYSLANREWWEIQNTQTAQTEEAEDQNVSINGEQLEVETTNNTERVFKEESESRRSLGLAYQTSDRFTVSADYIENNNLNTFNNDLDLNANTTVFGLQYDDPMGTIRASYQIDLNDELIQRITGVELDFNNLATFSASYKLLDPENIESTLKSQTAWDLGLGVTLNENYGLNLGYELIETEDQSEESERNISASFEINF